MQDLLNRAEHFATWLHAGQVRKYTGEPYINHPLSVAELVATVTDDEEMLVAAVLHDTVEDTQATLAGVEDIFGPRVAALVKDLTDVSKPEDGNRAVRKAIDRAHTALASPKAKTIKLADLIDNTATITQHDPEFARVYMQEMKLLLGVLWEGDSRLHKTATSLVNHYFSEIG
ncbi:MAG: HD domain-containing protein [Proteobacteria bacterium]|nr:HD domain-containing protein [Pseudomonadota bacterium]